MGIYTLIISALSLGFVLGDTSQDASLAAPVFSVQQPVDNNYYNNYPSAGGAYPEYDTGYPLQSQGEEDRQDFITGGLIGGVSLTVMATAFAAALAGAMIAPMLSATIARLMEFELPEITLPEFPEAAADEVRSLEGRYPWASMVETVYSALRSELNSRQSHKFSKFVNTDKL